MTRPLDRESRVYWWEEFLTMPPILNPETARSAAWIHAEFQGYPAAARKSNGRWRFLAVILRTLCSARTSGWQTAWPYYYKSVLKRSCQLGSCASRSRSWMCVPSSSPPIRDLVGAAQWRRDRVPSGRKPTTTVGASWETGKIMSPRKGQRPRDQSQMTSGRLSIQVTNAGPGFEPALCEGVGLAGLRERVESIGGHFDVSSSHRGICTLTLTVEETK